MTAMMLKPYCSKMKKKNEKTKTCFSIQLRAIQRVYYDDVVYYAECYNVEFCHK